MLTRDRQHGREHPDREASDDVDAQRSPRQVLRVMRADDDAHRMPGKRADGAAYGDDAEQAGMPPHGHLGCHAPTVGDIESSAEYAAEDPGEDAVYGNVRRIYEFGGQIVGAGNSTRMLHEQLSFVHVQRVHPMHRLVLY